MADIGNIQKREITDEMRESYLDYAMSVIVARALPDVRDGLKPVHRRILYAMHELGLAHSSKHRKSALVVGEVLGKYHPHGDQAVYDTLVRLAQHFALRYPLIDGQGNFGSIDGDGAAAMRYTEVRMARITGMLLDDIEKDTVNFRENYDATRQEPIVLPSAIPNLLLNGTIGIAVGMATNIPPHNLTEVMDALIHLLDNPLASGDDIMNYIKGPDFPTGGLIFDEKSIRETYATGRGAIVNRGKAEIEEGAKGFQIIVTEIPYQVNKSEMIEKIAELVTDKKLEGIRDLRDESDKDGLRVVVELKHDAQPQKVLNNLYKHTDLQRTFHLNMLALVDGLQPHVLSVKSVLEEFIKHRIEVVTRRTKFDLARTKDRIHILEGLKIALDHIDRVIETIKKSADKDQAKINLMKKFDLSDIQATAILEMRLQTLAGLERQHIEDELKEKIALAHSLEALLKDPRKIRNVIKHESTEIKDKFGDERKTKVVRTSPKEFSDIDLIAEEEVMVVLTRGGYIKRIKPDSYRIQKRGGKGLIGMETREEDVVDRLITCNTHAQLLFFTNAGKIYQVPAYEIPEASRISKGKQIFNFLPLAQTEQVTSILAIGKKKSQKLKDGVKEFVVMLTKDGIIKKVEADTFENVRRSGLIAITLNANDRLGWARLTNGRDELILVSKRGQSIRFKESEIRAMGRQAAGVHALKLKKEDEVIGMDVIYHEKIQAKDEKLLVMMEHGFGKQTALKQYKTQRRGGSGIKTANITPKTGSAISAFIIDTEESELIAISRKGQVIRMEIGAIPTLGRATQGVRIMRLDAGDAIASVTTF